MTTATLTITDFLLSRIAEDEAAARAVPPLDYNVDMGGNRQDERFTFGRTLPSSADGMGNWSKHRNSPTTRAHFARHDPARVLAECAARRRIVELAEEASGIDAALDGNAAVGPRTEPYIGDLILHALASVYSDHPDYREEWRP
jgi:hypothetical protein